MMNSSVVKPIRRSTWFAWAGASSIIAAYPNRDLAMMDIETRRLAGTLEPASTVVADYAFALGVVVQSPTDLRVYGLFNEPATATQFSRRVGGELRLIRVQSGDQELREGADYVPVESSYRIDPSEPG